jgi:hypothetical protein
MSRLAVCVVLFAASCLIVVQRAAPVAAQDKKNTVASLEKQLAALKQELAQGAQQNATLKQEIATLKQEIANLKAANAKLEAALKKANPPDATLKSLQATIDSYRGAGLVHVVVLKLKSDSSSGEAQSVIDDTYSQLAKIKTVRAVWAGRPSPKGTPNVAATDYTVALVFLFDDAAGLKTYLNDPVHTKFVDKHLKLWETPVVYDFEPKKLAPAPADPSATAKSLQAIIDGYRGAGLVHTVVLKLKSDSPSGEAQSVIDDAYTQLTKIGPVRGLWAGKPASKATPDASTDYTVALVLLFDDAAGLKSYLNDPVHTKFADNHLKKWETPVVYDFEPKSPSP